MDVIGRGFIAGFLATLILSVALDPIAMIARMMGVPTPAFGWLLHFIVGSLIWGAGFALVRPMLRGPSWVRGIEFGLVAWLIVMATVLAACARGSLHLGSGLAGPLAVLTIHLVYGALLGGIYGLLIPEDEAEEAEHLPEHAVEGEKHMKPLAH
jgi:hypothetical protein